MHRRSRKPKPNLDPEGTKALNLTVLQRIDPLVEKILMTASHVVVYELNSESNQWSRKDVEGPLFVVKRNSHPMFQFIVMNQLNTENFVENLVGIFEFEVQLHYLLLQNEAQEIIGVWFHNKLECEEVGNLFSRILSEYTEAHQYAEECKRKCEELAAVSSTSAIEGPPESMHPTAAHIPRDQSLLDLFSAAINRQNRSTSTVSNSIYARNGSAALPISSNSSTPQTPSTPYEPSYPRTSSEHPPKLLKPSLFFGPPVPSLTLPASAQHRLNPQLLHPFSPPTPASSLTPGSSPHHRIAINKEKVRNALQMLVQDDHFIEMFYQALQKVHHTNSTL